MDNLVKKFKEETDRRRTIRENKKLCERYPFLIPWNRWSGKLITDCSKGLMGYWPGDPDNIPDYDFSYTELDDMPDGWRRAFGLRMCEDLRNALIDDNDLDRWRIVQMKEKYGELRLYDNGHKIGSTVPMIIDRYAKLSVITCIQCGAPATRVTTGWISPYCDKCCPEEQFVPINEFYKEDETIG